MCNLLIFSCMSGFLIVGILKLLLPNRVQEQYVPELSLRNYSILSSDHYQSNQFSFTRCLPENCTKFNFSAHAESEINEIFGINSNFL